MSDDNIARWIYRFDNFKRAYELLTEAINLSRQRPLTPLEQEGLIQRFEYSWELAWKTIKDYLEHQGVVFDIITPASVLKTAFATKIIEHGDIWMQALDTRNKISHTYNFKQFEHSVILIETKYIQLFNELYEFLANAK